jgi:hypothetical protein
LEFFLNLAADQRACRGTHDGSEVAIADVFADSAADDGAYCGARDAVRVLGIGHGRDLFIPAFLSSGARGWLTEIRVSGSASRNRNTYACYYTDPRCFVHFCLLVERSIRVQLVDGVVDSVAHIVDRIVDLVAGGFTAVFYVFECLIDFLCGALERPLPLTCDVQR